MRISDWSSDVCSSDLIWNAPIVVTRGSDDRIQAFYNVCAHRGNQVVLTERGRASRFSCNYHNWVYRNDGNLRGVPAEANFFNLNKKNCGLVPLAGSIARGGGSLPQRFGPALFSVTIDTFPSQPPEVCDE